VEFEQSKHNFEDEIEFDESDTLDQRFDKVKARVTSRIKEIKRTKTPEIRQSREQAIEVVHAKQVESMLVDKLHTPLMTSQASVVVTSATAKFLIVKKESKNFLDAYLKGCIDQAVLAEDFFDYDRPLPSFEDVQRELARKRGYRDWKVHF
jgi:hypothetical protein